MQKGSNERHEKKVMKQIIMTTELDAEADN